MRCPRCCNDFSDRVRSDRASSAAVTSQALLSSSSSSSLSLSFGALPPGAVTA